MDTASKGFSLGPAFLPAAFGLWLGLGGANLVMAQKSRPAPAASQDDQRTVTVRADSQQKDKDRYLLRGHVEITYKTARLTADEATYNQSTGDVVGRGHVVFTDPQSHLAADEVHYNVTTKKGWFANGQGYLHPKIRTRPRMLTTENPLYIRAARVDRLDEDTYTVEGGRMTTCECEKKGWSVSARRARVQIDDKLVTRDAIFRLLGIPLFYCPYLLNSIARRPRQTGLLLPHIGNSTQKGFIVGAGFFWAINPSTDLLLGVENYSIRGPAGRAEFRARPSDDSDLTVDWFGVHDRGGGPLRQERAPGQSVRAVGQAKDLWEGFRGVIDVDYITSLAFRLTYTDNFTQAVTSETHQTGFLTKSFDAYSLNFTTSRYQNFFSAVPGNENSVVIVRAPTFDVSGQDKQVRNSPFYFSFDASAGGLGRSVSGLRLPDFSDRFDFHPQLTARAREFWGFHITPTVGLRTTYYGTSLAPDHSPLTRVMGEFSLDVRPPSFEKVFERKLWGRRIKHVIEPDITYRLVRARNADNLMDVVLYDETDILAETNELEYSLTNTLLWRKDAPDDSGNTPQAQTLLSLRLSQKYYFDPTFGGQLVQGQRFVFDPTIDLTGFAFAQGRNLSPIVSVLKLSPFSNYDTELRTDFSPYGGVLNAGITSHVHKGPVGLAFTDFFINRTAVFNTPVVPPGSLQQLPSFHLLRTVATYGDVNRKGFSGAFGVDYNFAQKIAHQVVSQLSYNFGCFGLDFEYRRFSFGPLRQENQFRVALSLANIGSFGNLKPRERLY
ncbi:MAG: LPS assembly protein LptD [Acidobacteriia bacterium]|nr:LPS assembly protein LptD [Terriglobia bacterium]